MFARNVKINYCGVEFWVNVCCTPATSMEELDRRAKQIITEAFSRNGIEIVK